MPDRWFYWVPCPTVYAAFIGMGAQRQPQRREQAPARSCRKFLRDVKEPAVLNPVDFIILFSCSMGREIHALGHRFGFTQSGSTRASAGRTRNRTSVPTCDTRPPIVRRRLYTQIREHDEIDDEHTPYTYLCQSGTITDRLDRAVVQPGQEEQDDDARRPSPPHPRTWRRWTTSWPISPAASTMMIGPLAKSDGSLSLPDAIRYAPRHHAGDQRIHHLAGNGPQHRVIRA